MKIWMTRCTLTSVSGDKRSEKAIESHSRSLKVKEGQGRSFPITGFTFQVRKVIGEVVGGVVVACRIIVSAPVPVPFLWTLDFGSGTWIWGWTWA